MKKPTLKDLSLRPVSMSSLEVAEVVGSRHDVVKKSIERLAKSGAITLPPLVETSFRDKIGKKQKTTVYTFSGDGGKRDCIVVVAQLSPVFTATIVDRWLELENAEARRREDALTKREASDLYIEQSKVIHDRNIEAGKEDKFYHFSNEADMINRIVLGKTAKQYKEFHGFTDDTPIRRTLTDLETAAITDLQKVNISLIALDMPFKERKERLDKLFMKRHNPKLIEAYTKDDSLV